MTDLLTDVKAFLVSEGLTASLIYKDAIPDSPDTAIVLYEYQGVSPMPQIAGSVRQVQVVTRSKSTDTAKQQAKDIHRMLSTEDGELQLTPERWSMTIVQQPPFKLKTDEAGRVYYVFNISITTYND